MQDETSPGGRGRSVTAHGTLRRQGYTGYQYGTHVLRDESGTDLYALTSETVDLDPYVDRYVTLTGYLRPGYPVAGGPDYLIVTQVQVSDSTA